MGERGRFRLGGGGGWRGALISDRVDGATRARVSENYV